MSDTNEAAARLRKDLAEFDDDPRPGLICVSVLANDLRVILDERDALRARLEAAEYDRDMYAGEMECQKAAKEQIQERLEAAEQIADACTDPNVSRIDLDYRADAYRARFGGRDDSQEQRETI